MKGLLHVHRKTAKGKTYYYFNTGAKVNGKPVLKALPDIRSPEFARAYQAAQAARSRRTNVEPGRNFAWLVRVYEKSPEFRALAENSKRNYSRHLGYAEENFRNGRGESWPLHIITSEHVVMLRDKFADRPGKANATIRAIMALYAWAKAPGRAYVATNIAREIPQLEGGEHQPWPEPLIDEALADPEIRLPVALLYFLGQRIGDTVKMGRGQLSNGIIAVTQEKTKTPLRIALHQRLAEILEADAPADAMVFLVNDKGHPLTSSALRQRIQKWALDRGHKIVPHGLRKNAVIALLEAGCSVAEVSAITGQDMATIEHYAKQRDREALSRSAVLKFEARAKTGTRKPGVGIAKT